MQTSNPSLLLRAGQTIFRCVRPAIEADLKKKMVSEDLYLSELSSIREILLSLEDIEIEKRQELKDLIHSTRNNLEQITGYSKLGD